MKFDVHHLDDALDSHRRGDGDHGFPKVLLPLTPEGVRHFYYDLHD